MSHAFITVVIPFDSAHINRVEAYLQTLGNPPTENMKRILDGGRFIHFMSISVLRGDGGSTSHIIMEASADGAVRSAIEQLADSLRTQIESLLLNAGLPTPTDESLGSFLERHHCDVGQGWRDITGLPFDGSPGLTLKQIRYERHLAKKIADIIDRLAPGTALETLNRVRNHLWSQENWKWAFFPGPTDILGKKPRGYQCVINDSLAALKKSVKYMALGAAAALLVFGYSTGIWFALLMAVLVAIGIAVLPAFTNARLALMRPVLASVFVNFIWLIVLIDAIVFTLTWMPNNVNVGAKWSLITLSAEVALGVLMLVTFRKQEQKDIPVDSEPNRATVAQFMRREGRAAQSHMAVATTVKPGRLRRFTLRLGLWIAGTLAQYFSRPGYLTEIGVIHFARWILIPGTNKLVFLSNYDGAFQSYLEDFIVRTPAGVTVIWNNTEGFPRTRNFIHEGAEDGDRLKRFIRRQQYPTLFWYSAYEDLTMTRIRVNSAIRNGISQAFTEEEAASWLAHFGAPAPEARPKPQPPPQREAAVQLEMKNISVLAFGGLSFLPYGVAFLLRFSDGPSGAAWLEAVQGHITYGDSSTSNARKPDAAAVLALSFGGLRKLGITEADLQTFPVAFQEGAAGPSRSAVLRDTGTQHPSQWKWGGRENDADAILLLYWNDDEEHDKLIANTIEVAVALGHEIRHIPFEPPRNPHTGFSEPFGFADGISQPIIRGGGRKFDKVQRLPAHTREKVESHVVEPGEFILGYRNNLGYFPPSPSVAANADPHGVLRTVVMDPNPKLAEKMVAPANAPHDIGRNGTYLVVRQLEQDREAFGHVVFRAATEVAASPRRPNGVAPPLPLWLESKMVGRWTNGTSLIGHPRQPGNADPDNEFLFDNDPGGVKCPFGAHIRRSNPRKSLDPDTAAELAVSNRHRILRVGRPYKSFDEWGGEKVGLMFMCLNSDIERQFEFIQQNWILGKTFHSLENETDPILGAAPGPSVFTIPTDKGPLRIKCVGPILRELGKDGLVKVVGAGYFFIPGRHALEYLASLQPRAVPARPPAAVAAVVTVSAVSVLVTVSQEEDRPDDD